jgi:hypothetical protein
LGIIAAVKQRATSEYIWLGTAIRYLRDVTVGSQIHGQGRVLRNLDDMAKLFEHLGLPVSTRALGWAGLKTVRAELDGTPDDATLTAEQQKSLNRAMSHLWTTVLAEASGVFAYVVTEKRVSTTTLLDDPESLFAPRAYDRLPAIAQRDFSEGARCIAFELPTAAAFYLMRGTEAVLRDFYCATIKQKRVDPLLWGPMVQHLRQRKSNPPPKSLLDDLDSIRIDFRNPTQHPEAEYDIYEAEDLLGLCVDVVNRTLKAKP